ncbi:pyridoxamine 5'-phosphate oxidase family protein [Hymenobacter negativus]|uniref:Pyridoxamine 5'-phosphate oxidase family protein n=1 Tax=Hymenobacter negativus TaxID=2795026 RepID=A0ABS3Q9K9_9BACT|nr:pyridoxamine 5'-phosphate oxidase family protein [Hymenobacter negativus]MBO2007821.1 pyridoxamine 5'-phosphate oxidase family protein [Hymenobacter negativus]
MKQYTEIDDTIRSFIEQQHVFFVGTAAPDGRVNVSPKGLDSFRVLDGKRVAWLNLTGSGNETAAHLREQNRITIMFCAFEGKPNILRLYGSARVFHPRDVEWAEFSPLFPPLPGARQILVVEIDLVTTSCGMAVPFMAYQAEREELSNSLEKKGPAKVQEYWEQRNARSLDGKPTGI